MAEIAGQSQASIGALYDYFPDKQSLALALLAQYTEEADAHWQLLLGDLHPPMKESLADLFVEGALSFVKERPAYVPLLDAPFVYSRSSAARQPLRRTVAEALARMAPRMTPHQALLSSKILIELIKGMLAVCKRMPSKERNEVTAEFKKVMKLYLDTIVD